MLKPGDILDGYHVIRSIGSGGFGEVWLCRSEAIGDYRAIKFIPTSNPRLLEKELDALIRYRQVASQLRSPFLMPIEHINRTDAGLFYVMPLADGFGSTNPGEATWVPQTLATIIEVRAQERKWFASEEIISNMVPLLEGLQVLSDAGLIHRDVKPENILKLHGQICLCDISLLGEDTQNITRRGTPGYSAPSWYLESGGHPDQYGAATTLYTLMTGNAPDKLGRSNFRWPPQGENSLSPEERSEWLRLHRLILRATSDEVSERFRDFKAMSRALAGDSVDLQLYSRSKVAVVAGITVILCAGIGGWLWHKNAPVSSNRTDAASQPNKEEPGLTPKQKADYQALAGIAQGSLENGDYASALEAVDTLLKTYPQSQKIPVHSLIRATALYHLNRLEEAKVELRRDVNIDANLLAIDMRVKLWESLGALPEAEAQLTRTMDSFQPVMLHYFKRAEIRAKLGNYAGVLADREAVIAVEPKDAERRQAAEGFWKSLETKYPGYAAFVADQPPGR